MYIIVIITGDGLVEWEERKRQRSNYAEEKRWVSSFDLKEENKDEWLTERGREFQITGPVYWKNLSLMILLPILRSSAVSMGKPENSAIQKLSIIIINTEYPRLSEESEEDSRDKATQRDMEEL